MIYLVYPGLGKTFLAQKDDRFCDINVRKFRDADFENYTSSYRGTKIKNTNPHFPNNLKMYMIDRLKSNMILLFAFKETTIQLLDNMQLDYAIVLPDESKLNELKEVYKQRGDSEKYIEQNVNLRYQESLSLAKQTGKKILYISQNIWLENII